MKIPKSFTRPHQPGNAAACATLKRDASRVIRRLASDLGLRQRDFNVRERRHRRHQADLYALHTDTLYVQISHAPQQTAASMSFRTCRGRDDHTGGRDNAVCLQSIGSPEGYASLVATLRVVTGRRS
ncbi:hypothetical protein CupriaWKF_30750 [Cupriavidus sp. WKF15]|uniref:hypothetical protein n=1 Tax=Cupriavidus sp. WKF15 TaxID=3032282 RepID=UPI0023E2129E|nr:hypothetical protein [Cupriavidus sp. WKF15]WER50737.1 hypothetical protein CupriaWKF_30750 [Cupriavidus sp. WKF15]